MKITIPTNPQMKNCNSRNYIDDIRNKVLMVLDEVGSSTLPSVEFVNPPRIDEHTIELDVDEDQQDFNDVAKGFERDIPMDIENEKVEKLFIDPLPIYPRSRLFCTESDMKLME